MTVPDGAVHAARNSLFTEFSWDNQTKPHPLDVEDWMRVALEHALPHLGLRRLEAQAQELAGALDAVLAVFDDPDAMTDAQRHAVETAGETLMVFGMSHSTASGSMYRPEETNDG